MSTRADSRIEWLVDEFVKADEATKRKTTLLLAEYEANEFENWCKKQRVNKDDPFVISSYETLHMLYIALWRRLDDEFHRMMRDARYRLKVAR